MERRKYINWGVDVGILMDGPPPSSHLCPLGLSALPSPLSPLSTLHCKLGCQKYTYLGNSRLEKVWRRTRLVPRRP